ncbi:hypothetical protein Bca52824_047865 [Brassica carinata]|uniref:Uncharacterized protein n=1 Tax=Brassica carinata TaxID=52824 RepID=A0A8X7UTQ2_BRACI|nr:hypothetical protein Bca52824_047865 [Brassica carinata]
MKNMDRVHKANTMDLNIKHLKFKEIMFKDNYFKKMDGAIGFFRTSTMSLSYLASTTKKSLRDFQFLKKTEIVALKPIGFLCSSIPLLGERVF